MTSSQGTQWTTCTCFWEQDINQPGIMLAAVKIAVILNMNEQIPTQDDYSAVRISLQLDSPYKSHPAFKTDTGLVERRRKFKWTRK